ncbi:MAG: VOC family protein [Kofleriaceae bacterium]|nr:VOC family protein [Kofleriaceae bacterium]MCL4223041.1 VOC family protein [Myxococcales bacterium]
MADPAAHVHHTIDYIELTVTDMAAARRFYAAAFGWAFTDYGPGYAGIRVGDREVGGLRLDDAVRAGGPLVILYSDELETTLAGVAAAGGAVVKPIFSFPGGRRFHFTDPAGNELAAWSARGA